MSDKQNRGDHMIYEKGYPCANCGEKVVETHDKCTNCGHEMTVVSKEHRKSRE